MAKHLHLKQRSGVIIPETQTVHAKLQQDQLILRNLVIDNQL